MKTMYNIYKKNFSASPPPSVIPPGHSVPTSLSEIEIE